MSTEMPTEPKNQTHLIAGGIKRLVPILMTVLALVPLALGGLVILWALVSSTASNMLVVPEVYRGVGSVPSR